MPDIHVCCGVGGVGKTTTAAALAIALAHEGGRVAVLTIDPAQRLADALGVQLGNDPQRVMLDAAGSLDALMLDRKATFDSIILRYAPDPDTAANLLDNRYYRAISTRLSGSHEYMAMEKLLELAEGGDYDTLVLDTPPTRHALDFLRAPDRMRNVLDPRLLGAVANPGRGLFSSATRRILSVIHRLAGEAVLGDLREFFGLLAGLSAGFRDRGGRVRALLAGAKTGYWLVVGADDPARDDALEFLDLLTRENKQFKGFLVNRVAARPADAEVPALPTPEDVDPAQWALALQDIAALHARRLTRARTQERALDRLRAHSPGAAIIPIAERPDGITTIAALGELGADILGAMPTA